MSSFPVFVRSVSPSGEARYVLGDPLVDRYLEFVAGRCRANTVRAVAYDLKTFFTVVDKAPVEVTTVDVFDFLAHQRGDRKVVRISDGESGLSARTIARRLSSVSGFYAYLVARGDTVVRSNPVPRGLSTRDSGGRRAAGAAGAGPAHAAQDLVAGRGRRADGCAAHHRDRAMVLAMVLGGLRRCEVLGLRLEDLRVGEAVVVHRRGQRRPSAGGADLEHVLRRRRRLPARRTAGGRGDGPGVRGA